MLDSNKITEVAESRLVGIHGDVDDVEASSAFRTWVHVFVPDLLSHFRHDGIKLIDESDIDGGISCDASAELEKWHCFTFAS